MSTIQRQAWFWGGVFTLFLTAFIWLFGDVLTPFVLGMAIAYLLNPVVQRLARYKIYRPLAALLILSFFILMVAAVIALVGPPAVREAGDLIEKIPGYMDSAYNWAEPHLRTLRRHIGAEYTEDAKTVVKENIGMALTAGGGILGSLTNGGQAVVGFFTALVLTPLVAYFMMQEWPRITGWIDSLIPRQNEKTVKDLIRQIDRKLSGFIRGQLLVAFFLALIYAVALSVAGLNYGFLIGLGAGVLSIIPLVGSTAGLLVAVVVAWFQTGELSYVGIIAAIFIVGQIVEGNFLTPKLVGDSVGIHPLWVIFALMAGGSLFGILGMLLAVPVAAVIGVLVGFAIVQYKKSPLYARRPGQGGDDAQDGGPHG